MANRLDQLFHFLLLDENDAFTLYSIGYEYMQLEEFDKAIIYFERLRKKQASYTGVYFHLGKCYEKLGKPELGMEIFQKGLAICEAAKDTHAYAELKNLIQNRELGIEED